MTKEELATEARAVEFAKRHRTAIARELASKALFPGEEQPVSVFMAGSPGAGKTEVSIGLVKRMESRGVRILRLDPDDLRQRFPDYTGSNSYLFQRAVSRIVERTHDLMLEQRQSFLLDGTLANIQVAVRNIERSLTRGRLVQIVYVYQQPELAWEFVLAREVAEGRNIPCSEFVRQFFASHSTVLSLKGRFGDDVRVDVIVKDTDGRSAEVGIDVSLGQVDAVFQHVYDPASLVQKLTGSRL
jgi:predicted ABC-type ATPase